MKKPIALLLSFLIGLQLYGVERQPSEKIEKALKKDGEFSSKVKVLPFAFVEVIVPGFGFAVRAPLGLAEVEASCRVGGIWLGAMGSAKLLSLGAFTATVLVPIVKTQSGQFYFGGGPGLLVFDDLVVPLVNGVLGYEGERFFADIGADITLEDSAPVVRTGFKF